jgi:hypothetical protein
MRPRRVDPVRACPAPARRRGSSYGRPLPRPLNIDGPPFAVSGRLDFERKQFAELRPTAIPRKGRDVDENRITAARRRDEAEAATAARGWKLRRTRR